MGAMKNQKLETKDRKRRGKVSATGEVADWGSADAALLQHAIELVCKAGGAIRFGYTRDGGAYAVGIYENGESSSEYIKPSEDLDEYLRGIVRDFEA